MSSSDTPSNIIKKLEVVEYNPRWPGLFESEAEQIKQALGRNCLEIHHIGSTSIPELSAKPIIDILPVVRAIQEVDKATKAMESLGYEAKGEHGIAFRRYFQKGKGIRTHHVHIYQENDPEISRYLKFRDWMRSHPDDAESYAKLKVELATKFPYDILQYCNGKDAFVASIDAKDGFDGWRIVKALTDREWNAVHLLRQKYFFKSKEDPYTWTFTHPDHVHFVFYKNAEIIGYTHLQLWPENRAALRINVIDEPYRKLGFGSLFLRLCERWLHHRGFKKLLIQSSQEACQFYRRHGYVDMPFNDPDEYERSPCDIEIGKQLTIDRIDRPKISVYIATSIDGYIARKDGGLDWLDRVGGFGEDYGFQKLLNSIDALIIGRKTYEVAITVPDPYPGKRVIVLSNSLNSVRKDMELYRGDLINLASQLHSDGVKHIWIDGGVTISQFLDLQMVDFMTLSVIPVILGSGIPLFNPTRKEDVCRTISSQSYPSGLVQLNYEINTHQAGVSKNAEKIKSISLRPATLIEPIEKKMKITLCKATKEDKEVIQNLGRFYVYEMSRYCGFLPTWEVPSNGLFECIDLSSYCEKPDRHAFLIRVDDELAGFVLIDKAGSTPDVDWNVGEFFIVSKFQGKGVGHYVAEQIFNQFPGVWEASQIPENTAAIDFWNKIVTRYSHGQFEKTLKIVPEPKPHPMIILKFTSQGSQ